MKYKTALFTALMMTIIWSCDGEFNTPLDCIDSSQVEGTDWFQQYTNQFGDDSSGVWYMVVGTYNFQTVFMPRSCCANCLWVPVVLNCRGEQIGVIGDGVIDQKDIKNEEVIWRSPNFQCQL